MTRCPDKTDWVLLAAGESSPRRRRALETHLVECAACREELAAVRRGLAALAALPRETPLRPQAAEALRRRLAVAAAHRPARGPVVGLVVRYGWLAAAAALVLAALLWNPRPEPPPAAPPPTAAVALPSSGAAVADKITEIAAALEILASAGVSNGRGAGGPAPDNGGRTPRPLPHTGFEELERLLDFVATEGGGQS